MGNFEEEKIPAKRAARIGQSFAASVPFDLGQKVVIREEEDVKAMNGMEFSDGIGKIGKEIMIRIKRRKHLSEGFKNKKRKEILLLAYSFRITNALINLLYYYYFLLLFFTI